MQCGCIPPLCELLTVQDAKIIQVALNGLDNILKAGEQNNIRPNPYAVAIEECYGEKLFNYLSIIPPSKLSLHLSTHLGLDKIEFLQSHQNIEIYQKVFDMIEQYFSSEEEDTRVAPQSDGNQYQFNPDPSAVSGFDF